ncbi:MAG: hypothetical protein NZ455_14245 [Bacteroidia bacterium]|nr:hypothetical protein [Bacteroidia bacterium]MDW8347310.1 hypothetical protein [Bacteroidia bacterium]
MLRYFFGRVPSLRFGSGYCALRVRFGATHCLTACSVSLTQQHLDVLPSLCMYPCFTLFNVY